MQFAQRQAVADDRIPIVLGISDDVGGIEQFLVMEPADGALNTISVENSFPESALVDTATEGGGDIAPLNGVSVARGDSGILRPDLDLGFDINVEHEPLWVVTDDEDGALGHIPPGIESDEQDQWHTPFHRLPQSHVVGMTDVSSSIRVPEVGAVHSVGIGSIRNCRDRQRQFTDSGLEDALRSQQRNTLALEDEPLLEERSGQDVAVQFDLLPQPLRGCEPNLQIPRGVHRRRIRPVFVRVRYHPTTGQARSDGNDQRGRG